MIWALFYWNARKSLYQWGGRRSRCPCRNPSDPSEAMVAGCDAVLGWRSPARFRRVCPLLQPNEAGNWVCSVRTEEVRPFWGRVMAGLAGSALLLALVVGLALFGTMRLVGFPVSLRQVFWPRAWGELPAVREQFFIEQAKAYYTAGKTREAVSSLSVAFEMNPRNYSAGMILAQFYQTARPDLVDRLYGQLQRTHPEHRAETARAWLRSLLARGQIEGVANLARREIVADAEDPAAWTHALVMAARWLKQPQLLDETARENGLRKEAVAVLELESLVGRTPRAEVPALLLSRPIAAGFPYAWVHRIGRLIEFGATSDALVLLRQARGDLGGRDLVRLALAAYAAGGDSVALQHETGLLLAPGNPNGAAGVRLVALHLIRYPDATILRECAAALAPAPREVLEDYKEALVATYCAAVFAADQKLLPSLRAELEKAGSMREKDGQEFERLLAERRNNSLLQAKLALIRPMSLELNYAILQRLE